MSSHHLNPRSLLNTATRTLIDRVQRAGRPPMHALTAPQARAFYDIGGPILDLQPAPHVDRVQDFTISARDGHDAVRLGDAHGADVGHLDWLQGRAAAGERGVADRRCRHPRRHR